MRLRVIIKNNYSEFPALGTGSDRANDIFQDLCVAYNVRVFSCDTPLPLLLDASLCFIRTAFTAHYFILTGSALYSSNNARKCIWWNVRFTTRSRFLNGFDKFGQKSTLIILNLRSKTNLLKKALYEVNTEIVQSSTGRTKLQLPSEDYREIYTSWRSLLLDEYHFQGSLLKNVESCTVYFISIYFIKMYTIWKRSKQQKRKEKCILRICIFVIKFYVKAWFYCTSSRLTFFKDLRKYQLLDTNISKTCYFVWMFMVLISEPTALLFLDVPV